MKSKSFLFFKYTPGSGLHVLFIKFIRRFCSNGRRLLCSPKKKEIKWRPIASLLVVEVLITWFMLGTSIGTWIINKIASFFTWLISCANDGIAFAFPSVMGNQTVDFSSVHYCLSSLS